MDDRVFQGGSRWNGCGPDSSCPLDRCRRSTTLHVRIGNTPTKLVRRLRRAGESVQVTTIVCDVDAQVDLSPFKGGTGLNICRYHTRRSETSMQISGRKRRFKMITWRSNGRDWGQKVGRFKLRKSVERLRAVVPDMRVGSGSF